MVGVKGAQCLMWTVLHCEKMKRLLWVTVVMTTNDVNELSASDLLSYSGYHGKFRCCMFYLNFQRRM
jgi:hypothetical protein